MPRKAQGSTFSADGAQYARVVIAPKKYTARSLMGTVDASDEIGAQAWASVLQDLVTTLRVLGRTGDIAGALDTALRVGREDRAHGLERVRKSLAKLTGERDEKTLAAIKAVAKPGERTFQQFAEQWTSGELHRLFPDHIPSKRSADADVSRLETHVYKILGHVPLSEVSLDLALDVMRRIPEDRASSTRRHVAQVMVRLMKLAVFPCRYITTNPLPAGFLPKITNGKALTYLYPDEDRKLLTCTKPEVPLANRVLYGVLAREGMRASEALSLAWDELDLKRGLLRLDENKTDDPRAWSLDPSVCLALKAWHRYLGKPDGSTLVFPGVVDEDRLAEVMRSHLVLAGVDRKELFERTKARRPIRAHDLRATFITVNLANGQTETWISDRTGHESSQMIHRYKRAARTWTEAEQGALAPLHTAIPELRCREGAGSKVNARSKTTKKPR